MSLIDNMRQTLNDVTDTVVERSQHLSSQAKLQVTIKKLQLERARRLQDLGARTFDWYQSGSLTVGGPVPSDVSTVCQELADIQSQLNETERQLEEAKRLAEEARLQASVQSPLASNPPTVIPDPHQANPAAGQPNVTYPAPGTPPPPPGAGQPPSSSYPASSYSTGSTHDKSTNILNDSAGTTPPYNQTNSPPDVMRP